MPTYREDLHLGHKVPTVETDDLTNHSVTAEKMSPGAVGTDALQDLSVTEPKLADGAVSTRTIQDYAVTEPKMADNSVSHRTIQDDAIGENNIQTNAVTNRQLAPDSVATYNIQDEAVTPTKVSDNFQSVIVQPLVSPVDQKFTNITNELYSLIRSLQVGGVALSQAFGDNTDIGISQKTLTKAIGRLWDELGTITGNTYMDYTLTIQPSSAITEGSITVLVTADCSDAISNFDSIKVYQDGVLKAESSDITVFNASLIIDSTSQIRVEGTILGKTIIKEQTVTKMYPFFMGSGNQYTDVLTPECQKEMLGSLEGDYDVVVKNTGEYIFLIIPLSHKDEFRRAVFDMNGFEIPLTTTETTDFIICQTMNRYQAGTYNIDININR